MHLKLLVFSLLSVYCTNGGRQERIRGLRDLINYPDAQESYFRANRMYTFKYDGQVNIGVPDHSDQHSASRMQADVVLVKRSDEHFIIRLRGMQVAKQLSRIEDPRQIHPFEQFEKIEMNPRDLTILELPVEFTYSDGQIQDLVFQQREEEWSANLKRGVLSMLQIKLQPKDRNSMEEEQSALNKLDTESKTDVAQVYRTTEKTVEGECDTMYSVNLIRDHTDTSKTPNLIVTKSVDLTSCQKRPKIMTNFQFVQRCPRCQQLRENDDRAIQSSTTMQYQIRGKRDKFLVEFVQMSNDHVIAPQNENENAVVVTIRASLRMVNSQETNQQDTEMSEFPQTGQKVTDIIYSTETEEKQIRFQMQGDNQYPTEMGQQRRSEQDKVSTFGEVLMKMIHQMRTGIDDKVNRYLSRAIAMVRTMRENELRAAIQQYSSRHQSGQMSPEENEKMRNMIPHILAQAGTFNSIKQLSEKIISSEISPFKATMAIPGLMNAAYVSEEMVNELIRLEQSSVAQRNPILKKTIMLTIGSMMKTACAPQIQQQQQQKYMEARRPMAEEYKCSSETKQRFARFISECMRRSNKWEEKTLCLRVLGNAGLDSSVQEIEAILRTTDESVPQQSSTIRLEAVMALRHLRHTLPQKTRSILLATATNKLEYSAVRMAAVQQLMLNNPGKLTTDQIISLINHDPDRRLASFAYQLMRALSESKLGCYHEMNHDLKASIKRVRRISQQMPVSDIIFESLEDDEKKIGMDVFMLPFYDSDEIVPKYMKAGINTIIKGVRAKNLIAFEMGTNGLSSIISDLVQSMPETEKRSAGSAEYGLNLRRFADKMSTNQRSEWRNQKPNAWMSLKFKNQDIFLYTVNEQTLKEMIQFDGIQTIRALTNYMANIPSAIKTDGGKLLQETSIKIPTAIGTNLRLKKKTPIVLSIHGHISSENDRSQAVNFRAQGKLSAAMSMVTDVSSRCPIMNNGIYLIRTAKVMIPIDMSLFMNPKQQDEQIKWTFGQAQANRDLLKVESRPVIYFKRFQRSQPEYEEKTIVADRNTKMESFKRCMQMPIFGSEMCMRGLVSKPTCSNNKLGHFLAPWFGPNKVVFTTYPKESGGRQVTMSISVQRGAESQGEEEEKKIHITVQTGSGKQTMDIEMTKSPDSFVPKQMKAKIRQQSQDQQDTELCMVLNSHRQYKDEQMPTGQQDPKKLSIDLKMNWGPQCRAENYWQAKIDTAYKQKMYREQRRTLALVDDQDMNERATYLSAQDETAGYRISIKHNNMPENVREIYNGIIDFITHMNYWNSQTKRSNMNQQQQQGPNEEFIQMVMKNNGRADIKIQTPTKTIVMDNVRIPSFLRYEKLKRSNLMRLSKVLVNTNSGASCKVQQDSIHTFDGAMYRIPFGDCYTILAKNEYPQFTVKAKRSPDQPDKKVVKVTTADHEIKMKPEQETVSVKIDGKVWDERSFTDRSNIQIGRVGRYVSVQLIKQNVRVNFDGESITIWAPEKHHGQRLGMCGNMNADASDEFGYVHSDDRTNFWKLFKQMTESDATCRTPEPQQDFDHRLDYEQSDDDEKELSHRHMWNRDENEDSNWFSMDFDQSESRQGERRRYKQYARQPDNPEMDDVLTEVSPIRRNKIIEQRGRKCISMTPVERCPEHSYVADRAQEQREIQYTCLDRQDPLFAKTREMRRQGGSMDLSDRQVSFSRTEMVPRKCVIV